MARKPAGYLSTIIPVSHRKYPLSTVHVRVDVGHTVVVSEHGPLLQNVSIKRHEQKFRHQRCCVPGIPASVGLLWPMPRVPAFPFFALSSIAAISNCPWAQGKVLVSSLGPRFLYRRCSPFWLVKFGITWTSHLFPAEFGSTPYGSRRQ